MPLLHCTKKLLDILKADIQPVTDNNESAGMGNWYANIFFTNRIKNLIFTNELTLYSFIAANLNAKEIRNIYKVFIENLTNSMKLNKIDEELSQMIIGEYLTIDIAKTNSRSVLGSMNDFVLQYEYYYFESLSENRYSIENFNIQMNKIPMGALKYKYPIDLFKNLANKNLSRKNLKLIN